MNFLCLKITVSVALVEAGFSQAGGRHAKFTVVEVEPNWIGMSSRRVISPDEAGESIDGLFHYLVEFVKFHLRFLLFFYCPPKLCESQMSKTLSAA